MALLLTIAGVGGAAFCFALGVLASLWLFSDEIWDCYDID